MASTYSSLLRAELQASGENATSWGDKTNTNLGTILESAIAGTASVVMTDTNYTLSVNYGSVDESRCAIVLVTGTNTASRNIVCPTSSKTYVVKNSTVGGFPIVFKTAAGTGITIPNGNTAQLFCDGTNVVQSSIQISGNTGTITPVVIGAGSYAWRFDSAIGVGRTQAIVPNYGVLGIDGTNGSYTEYFVGGVQSGTVSGTATAFDISSPSLPVTITTNSIPRMSINTTSAAFSIPVVATSLASTGDVSGTTGTFSSAVSGLSFTSSTGYAGVTSANVTNGLGYAPVQQGTGVNQDSSTLKLGWSGVSKLKLTVGSIDKGNIALEGLANSFTQDQTVTGTGSVTLSTAGDITASRGAGTTGVLNLGQFGRYLYNDGSLYRLSLQGLTVEGVVTGTGLTTSGTVSGDVISGNSMGLTGNASILGALTVGTNLAVTGGLTAPTFNGYVPMGIGLGQLAPGQVLEVGRYIDFHTTNTALDYDVRIDCVGAGGISGGGTMNIYGSLTTTGTINGASDERLKTNWRSLATPGYNFVYGLSNVKSGVYDRIDLPHLTQVGVSAQSLQHVLPEAVTTDANGMLSVAYGNAALAACIELAKEVVMLKDEISELKSLLNK